MKDITFVSAVMVFIVVLIGLAAWVDIKLREIKTGGGHRAFPQKIMPLNLKSGGRLDNMAVKHTFITKDGHATRELTGMSAIRQKCLECCAWNYREVSLCVSKDCALHPFRFGRYPKKTRADSTFKESNPKTNTRVAAKNFNGVIGE